jgi:hypothetical protein
MTESSCRGLRELLGVYVVGAIEPAERSLVDSHLAHCYECREELAGLAGLPALLHRVSVADAERIAEPDAASHTADMPSEEILTSLLRRVRARRTTQQARRLFATAAALLIAAGGAFAAARSLAPQHPQPVAFELATASNGPISAWVKYRKAPWGGTTMSVQVTGLTEWTTCKFWVLTKTGQTMLAGGWIVGPGSAHIWYPVQAGVQPSTVAAFKITTSHGRVLRVPAP